MVDDSDQIMHGNTHTTHCKYMYSKSIVAFNEVTSIVDCM